MVEDLEENTALHQATKGSDFLFSVSLVDLVNCQHAVESLTEDHLTGRKEDVQRQGCIELLLQVGFDIWKTKIRFTKLHIRGLLAWWYKKSARETMAQQNT